MTYLTFIKLKLLIKNRHEPCHTFKHFNIYKAKVSYKKRLLQNRDQAQDIVDFQKNTII